MTVEQILTGWIAETPSKSLEIQRADHSTLYDSDSVYYCIWNYWTYVFVGPPGRDTSLWIYQCWLNFVALYGPDLERAYDALYASYDPLANYDMTETSTDGQMQDDKTDTVTPQGKTVNLSETLGKLETENKTYVAGYDSTDANGAFSDRQVSTVGPASGNYYQIKTSTSYEDQAKTETKHTAQNQLASTLLPGSGYNALNDHVLTRKGNIGVTSTVQLIAGELELRKTELLDDFIRRFIKRHFAIMG